MVARIAPSPIAVSVAVGDPPTHAAESHVLTQQQPQVPSDAGPEQPHAEAASAIPPHTPPGEAFAAAVISGQLSPRPTTTAELRQRLGSAWQPPASPLRLMDRSV
jgi:hypothetical protein